MGSDLITEMQSSIALEIELGFRSAEEIAESVDDLYGDEEDALDGTAVRRMVAEEMRRYLAQRASSSVPSDAERLVRAFEVLEGRGIYTRHAVGVSPGDASDVVLAELRDAKAAGEQLRGSVFYSGDKVDSIVEHGELALSFAPLGVAPADQYDAATRLGGEIIDVLQREGLRTRWDGDPNRWLRLVDLRWLAPRDPATGAPLLRLEGPRRQAAPSDGLRSRADHDDASASGPTAGSPRFERDSDRHWLLRIAIVSVRGGSAHALLQRLDEVVSEGGCRAGPIDIGTLDPTNLVQLKFVPLNLKAIDGSGVNFIVTTLIVPPARAAWRDIVLGSHGVVFVADEPKQLDQGLASLRAMNLPNVVVALEGDGFRDHYAASLSDRGFSVTRTRAVADGSGTMEPLKAVAKLVLTDLKASL